MRVQESIRIPTFEGLAGFRDELFGEWGNMLSHQLPSLPPVESFWDALPEFFAWLGGTMTPVAVSAYPLAAGEQVLRAPAGAIRIPGRITPAIEVIRFAGANRLCVELDYIDQQGRRSVRTIEPYSLRRTQAGDIVLHAVRADEQQHRSYRIDQIQGASVTSRTFTPRYAVELTPTGPLVAPQTTSRVGATSGLAVGWGHTPRTGRHRVAASGPVYVYRCPVCGKKFEHKTRNATIRTHKNPQGWNCSGRRGIFERIK
jgi:hypothetical protein